MDRIQNAETLRTAEAAKAQRLIELQNTVHGFSNVRLKGGTLFIQYIEEKAKEGTICTNGTYYELLYHLRQYSPKITLQGINRPYLLGFLQYLRKVPNRMNGRKLAPNTVWTICNKMNVFLNKAVRDGLISTNPYNTLEGKERAIKEPVNRAYLTADELRVLSETPCPNEAVKRAFLFCCFCGLRFSDVEALKWGDIRLLSDGTKQAEIRQQKTREPLYLPLSKNALKWLPERAEAPDAAPVFDLPGFSMCARVVPRWCKAAGINKRITFHCSRHTAATLLLSYGADIYTVSKLLGHTSVKTTQIYAKVIDENKRRAVDLIPDI
jgi:integrase